MEIRAIRSGEERSAAALVYELTRGSVPDEQSLEAFLDQALALGTDLSRQVVAVASDGSIVGSSMYFPLGDGTATVLTPLCAAGYEEPEVQRGLLRALADRARAEGLHTLQVFTSQDDARTHDLLATSGFERLAVLLFMTRSVTAADRNIALDKQIRWIPYSEERHEAFVRVVGETYRETLDCRRLGESRDPAETLAGYLARGEIDPSLWLLAQIDGEDVACLLLLERAGENACEVGYVGVVPAHRGKGLGRKVMEKGLVEVALRPDDTLMKLAVDEENIPAIDMYNALGFTVSERRQVHVSLLATT